MSHWVYHPEHEAKIVSTAEYKSHLENGWYDTPAKFNNKNSDVPCGTLEDQEVKRRGRPPKVKDKVDNIEEKIVNEDEQG